jgi:pyruvate/2-oxoglutarate dehydrogenase complex dihydrolipoamide acyltransferase (E2) component
MSSTTMRVATALALVLVAACGGSESTAPTTTTTAPPPSTTATPTTVSPTTTPPTTLPAATNPEDARRILQQHGIDPDELSKQIGEQMRRRFQQQNGNN